MRVAVLHRFYCISLTTVVGTQKNQLIEMVLLSTNKVIRKQSILGIKFLALQELHYVVGTLRETILLSANKIGSIVKMSEKIQKCDLHLSEILLLTCDRTHTSSNMIYEYQLTL